MNHKMLPPSPACHARMVGGGLVITVLAAQTHWMGPAIVLLSGGLVVAYGVWIAGRWKNDAAAVLPI